MDANHFPFLGDAGAPQFLGVVGLAGGKEEGGHQGLSTSRSQLAEPPQTLAEWRILGRCRELFCILQTGFDLFIEFGLMIEIVGESRVNLGDGEMWVLVMHLLGTPTIGKMVQDDFNNFDVGFVNPGPAFGIGPNVSVDCFRHKDVNGLSLAEKC
jgi:hypothetical protein